MSPDFFQRRNNHYFMEYHVSNLSIIFSRMILFLERTLKKLLVSLERPLKRSPRNWTRFLYLLEDQTMPEFSMLISHVLIFTLSSQNEKCGRCIGKYLTHTLHTNQVCPLSSLALDLLHAHYIMKTACHSVQSFGNPSAKYLHTT